jgi:hypothetical protein
MTSRSSSFSFVRTCQALTGACRRQGLVAPSFRSPPGLAGATRTIRRRPAAAPVVAVRHRGRQPAAVVADLVEGVLVANGISGPEAMRVRSALWEAVTAGVDVQAA